MQFGKVDDTSGMDFNLPKDHPETKKVLGGKPADKFNIYIGCAKWNKTDLKNFYPKGTKDLAHYYSTQFNSIEFNASFYGNYSREDFHKWKEKTAEGFKFFPKVRNTISHLKRLNDVKILTEEFCQSVSGLEEKLGMVFLQMIDNFKPKDYDRLEKFVLEFPKSTPLAIELRNEEWFSNKEISDKVCKLFKDYNVANIIVDTAGRRDIIHMHLTSPVAFIRYVGANNESDYTRLDSWIERINEWKKQGLKELYFFIHQNEEVESPLIAADFIKKLNKKLNINLTIPYSPSDKGNSSQPNLF